MFLVASFAALVAVPCLAQDQKFVPRSIAFTGAPEFTKSELMAAAHLHAKDALTVAEMREHASVLLDTGLFEKVSFTFTGVDLAYQLKSFTELLPAQMPNLPPLEGLDMEASLRASVPLYHGRVPADGGLCDQVRAAMEQILATKGIQATVVAAANAGAAAKVQLAMNYSITSPQVQLGKIAVDPASGSLDPAVLQILKHLEGTPYDAGGTPSQIATYVTNYYHDAGYLEALANPHQQGTATVAADAINVPFTVAVTPGPLYRLNAIHLDPSIPEPQSDFNKKAALHPGDIARGQQLTQSWEFLARQYHNQGFMSPSIRPEPVFDRSKATVEFNVTATPGPVYTMGKLTLENVTEELRTAFLAAWPLRAGAIYNEGQARGFFATQNVHPELERIFATATVRYEQIQNDDAHTVDLVVKMVRK
jgi:hypothetical protein